LTRRWVMWPIRFAFTEQNEQLLELEAQRDLTQYIVHVDMDAFFAAVEV
jgi:hypothetical protein